MAAAFGATTDWETSKGDDRYRRALYTRWRRNLPYPSMIAFDAPERSVCSVVKNPVHVHDVQATILQQSGLDHTRLTYRFQGRDFRLTDVHGKVVESILS